MRLNKLSELIHSSSEHKSDVKYASVEVYFQEILDDENEPDSFEVIPGTQFRVARSVNRSSASKYMLNGRDSTFKEVCELLQGKGIDLEHNRFLILQGEVEQISLMKPIALNSNETGLLEYLEDIIGSNKYVDQIEVLEKALEDKNDERIEKTNRVKAAQVETRSLEGEKNVAVNYIKKERDYMLLTNMLYFIELGDGVKYYNESIEKIHTLRERLRKQKELMKQKFTENQQLVTEIQQLHLQIETADKKIKELQHEFQLLERSDIMIQNEKKHKLTEITKLKETIFNQTKAKETTILESSRIEADMPILEQQRNELQENKSFKEQEFERLEMEVRQRTERLREEKESVLSQKNPLLDEQGYLKSQIDSLKQDIDAIEGKTVKIENDIRHNAAKLDDQMVQLSKAQNEHKRHQDLYEQIQKEYEDTEKAYVNRKNDFVSSEMEFRQLKDRKLYMQNSRRQTKQKSNVLKELLLAQEKGLLQGIYGRLGDQGKIDSQYDIAISTACHQLDYIVVDSIRDAEQCVNYLKDNNIGRASFIGLDKMVMQKSYRSLEFKCPRSSKRLYDLITAKDEKFCDAFYYALKDTLVVNDIKMASEIAYNSGRNYRVVTQKGEMIDLTGVMQGGGRVKKGLMGNKIVEEFTDKQLDDVEEKITQCKERMFQYKDEYSRFETQKSQIQRKIQQHGSQRERAKVDVESIQEMIQKFDLRALQLQKKYEKAKQEEEKMVEIRRQISENSTRLSEIQPQIQDLNHQQKLIESQITEVGGIDYKSKKDEVDLLSNKLIQVERQLTRYKTTLQSSESNIRKFDLEIEKNKQAIEQADNITFDLQKELDKNDEAGKKILQEIQSCEITKQQCHDKLEERKLEFNQMKRDMQEITDQENEIKNFLEDAGKQKLKYKEHCDKMKTNIKGNREKFKKQEREFEGLIENEKKEEAEIIELDRDDETSKISSLNAQDGENSQVQNQIIQQYRDNEEKRLKQNEDRKKTKIQLEGYNYFWRQADITHTFNDPEIEILARDKQEIRSQAQSIRSQLESTNPNIQIIHEYKQKSSDCRNKENVLRECENFIQSRKDELNGLKKMRHDEFMNGFKFIASKVKEMYRLITNGGDAELEIKDTLDPFAEGVLFQVRPFKKSWKHMSKLSGGEKTLSSLSLIFALHLYKPSPLYCMDEIDAALDYKNVAIAAKYIREKAKNCQFLIISLRNNMFDLAQKLVGIYKTHDITKTLTISPKQVMDQIDKIRKEQELTKQLLAQADKESTVEQSENQKEDQ